MSTTPRYAIAVDDTVWPVPGQFETVFRWEHEDGRESLLSLYEKGKRLQWNATTRIDWSQDLDPEALMRHDEQVAEDFDARQAR